MKKYTDRFNVYNDDSNLNANNIMITTATTILLLQPLMMCNKHMYNDENNDIDMDNKCKDNENNSNKDDKAITNSSDNN